jgi:hypothetical protein
MRAYSQDFRQRLLHAVDQGMSRAEIIKIFAVSRSTIKRYLKLRRETGDINPKAIPGRPSKKGAALHAGLLPQLEAHPDATLVEHCLNPRVCSISKGKTRLWSSSTQPASQYDAGGGALADIGMGEAFILEGSADTAAFELYMEHILAPSLLPGHIVVLDNLHTHTGEKVRQAIEARGCQLLFLPSYSPDSYSSW